MCHGHKKRGWYEANKEHVLRRCKEWDRENPDKVRERNKRWNDKNSSYMSEYKRQYNRENREAVNAQVAIRRKRVQRNTPPWADKRELRNIYRNCPEGHHVDHIIPLNGDSVCGLHVAENLQYLPAEINLRKSNKYAVPEEWEAQLS